MKSLLQIQILTIFLVTGLNLHAANKPGQEVLDTGTIQQQLDFVISKSSTYENYKVIRIAWINKLKNHVSDSLEKANKLIAYNYQLFTTQKDEYDSLASAMQQTQVQLKNAIQEKNTLKLLGVPMSKQSYNGIVWILILALSVLLVILFLAFKRGHAILKSTRQELNELKDTFEAHRIRAREREEKMARKHLDEVLKYKSKMGIN